MAHFLRPLILSPATKTPLSHYITQSLFSLTVTSTRRGIVTSTISPAKKSPRSIRPHALRPAEGTEKAALEVSESEKESEEERKSRNLKKREARRGVVWAMELAKFNDSQIKRLLRVVSLEREVFDAVMLVKRLGRDVREGKRRQFSYIGRLLRDVDPDLMGGLINAIKDGDQKTFQQLSDSVKPDLGDTSEEEEIDDEQQGFGDHHDIATVWFDGLVNKDADITKEIYSLSTVDFDRQELRKLVRNFCLLQAQNATLAENERARDDNVLSTENEGETDEDATSESEGEIEQDATSAENEGELDQNAPSTENEEEILQNAILAKKKRETEKKLLKAKKSLTNFLLIIAKQLPAEENYVL